MRSLSELFDSTTLVVPCSHGENSIGESFLSGHNLSVMPVSSPIGRGLRRKLLLPFWIARNSHVLIKEILRAHGVHAPVPGDIGTIGILIALAQRKPLFVRHCGTWGAKTTLADRFLGWLLPRISNGRNVVLATGGGISPPCPGNPAVSWIFATTISEREWSVIPEHKPWRRGKTLKLITVSRLDPEKNTEAVVRALPLVRSNYPRTILNVVGNGPCLTYLKRLVNQLDLGNNVIFHGRLIHEDVMKILSDSDVFVFPTRVKEGFPKVVLEALACGVPVIAPDVSVIPSLVENNGFILKNTDPCSVAEAIIHLMSDEARLNQMSSNARDSSRHYTLERWRDLIGNKLRSAWGPLKNGETITSGKTCAPRFPSPPD